MTGSAAASWRSAWRIARSIPDRFRMACCSSFAAIKLVFLRLTQHLTLAQIEDFAARHAEDFAQHRFVVLAGDVRLAARRETVLDHAHRRPGARHPPDLRMENFARKAALAQMRIAVK